MRNKENLACAKPLAQADRNLINSYLPQRNSSEVTLGCFSFWLLVSQGYDLYQFPFLGTCFARRHDD